MLLPLGRAFLYYVRPEGGRERECGRNRLLGPLVASRVLAPPPPPEDQGPEGRRPEARQVEEREQNPGLDQGGGGQRAGEQEQLRPLLGGE